MKVSGKEAGAGAENGRRSQAPFILRSDKQAAATEVRGVHCKVAAKCSRHSLSQLRV